MNRLGWNLLLAIASAGGVHVNPVQAHASGEATARVTSARTAPLALPLLPFGLVVPPVPAQPWATTTLTAPSRDHVGKEQPMQPPYRVCSLLPDDGPFAVVRRNGKYMHAAAAFPALYSTPPKLWDTGRCAGEGMR